VLAIGGLGFVTGRKRRRLGRGTLWFLAVVVVTTVVGLLGIVLNKTVYIRTLFPQARLLWAASLGVCLLVAILWLVGRRARAGSFARTWRTVGIVLSSGTAAVLLFWLSRPLWLVSRQGSTFQQPTVALLQQQEGLKVDPARSYEEHTLSWLAWYFGWPMVGLAIIGFVLLVYLGIRRRSLPFLILAAAPLAVAALYFTRVSITPSQIWAFRRLLPIVTPGFLIASVFPLRLLWGVVRKRGPVLRIGGRIIAAALACTVALGPLVAWNSVLLIRDGDNQLSEITALCAALHAQDPGATTVALVRDGAPPNYALTLKAVCNLDVASISLQTTKPGSLSTLQKRVGDVPVVVYAPSTLPNGEGKVFADISPVATVTVTFWGRGLLHLPNDYTKSTRSVWLGTLEPGGVIVPAVG